MISISACYPLREVRLYSWHRACVRACVCRVCVRACVRACVCACVCACAHAHVCLSLYHKLNDGNKNTCIYVCMYGCMCVWLFTAERWSRQSAVSVQHWTCCHIQQCSLCCCTGESRYCQVTTTTITVAATTTTTTMVEIHDLYTIPSQPHSGVFVYNHI